MQASPGVGLPHEQEEDVPDYGKVFKESFKVFKEQGPKDSAPQTCNLDFSKQWKRSDAVLTVDNNQKFHVHTATLARVSPVFEELLTPENLAKYPNKELYLPGKNADEFREFLKVLYSAEPVREYKIHFLLPLAHEFKTLVVLKRCEESLMPKVKNETLAFKYLSIAQMYGLEMLRRCCVKILKYKSLPDLRANRMYREIAPKSGWDITEGRVEILESELGQVQTKLSTICEQLITELFGELYTKQSGGRPPPMNATMANKLCFVKDSGIKSPEIRIISEALEKLEKLYS
ncbi:uncharacterized protein LOC5500764 [Nematostella vectensis]|nr:uncharacterized protein LOC5500764 [Nematostella vectensis]